MAKSSAYHLIIDRGNVGGRHVFSKDADIVHTSFSTLTGAKQKAYALIKKDTEFPWAIKKIVIKNADEDIGCVAKETQWRDGKIHEVVTWHDLRAGRMYLLKNNGSNGRLLLR